MTDYSLKFDGYKLSLIGDGAVVKSWDAISGNPGSQSPDLQGDSVQGAATGRHMEVQYCRYSDNYGHRRCHWYGCGRRL